MHQDCVLTQRPSSRLQQLLMASTAAISFMAASPALAQSAGAAQPAAAATAAAPAAQAVEEIVVTGTSIRGVAPTGSNLVSVGRDAIVATGATTTADLLSTIPQLGNFQAVQENSTPNRFRTPGYLPNIHDLGIYATLTLFNGHRVSGVGGEATFTDPQAIPVIAVERVEVVPDGASAIYGSDAVAGVVNFIYRKNFNGVDLNAEGGWGKDYRKSDFAALLGKTWDRGGAMLAYEYSDNTAPINNDYSFLRQNQTSRGGGDYRSSNCSTPNLRINNVTYDSQTLTTAAVNRCESALAANIFPLGHRNAMLLTAHENVTSDVDVFAEVNFSDYRNALQGAPGTYSLTVPNTSPWYRAPSGVTATSEALNRSTDGLLPAPRTNASTTFFAFTLGSNIQLGHQWSATAQFNHSQSRDFNGSGSADVGLAQAMVLDPTTGFNPYVQAAGQGAGVLAQLNDNYASRNYSKNFLDEAQVKADGPIIDLPGGPLRAAVGASYRQEETDQTQTGGPLNAQFLVRHNDIQRRVTAAFMEFNVPVIGPANELPGIHRFDVSISGRYDDYQNLGGVFNPKLGGVIDTIGGLSIRGSVGTSYVAPNIGKLSPSFGIPIIGIVLPGGRGANNVYNEGGDNPNLQSQKATTYSLGGDYKPTFLPNLKLGITYFYVHYTNLVYQPGFGDLFSNPVFASRVIAAPTPAQVAAAIAFAPPQSYVPSTINYIVQTYALNIGQENVGGLDLSAAYAISSPFGHWTVGLNATRMLQLDQQLLPTMPVTHRIGTDDAVRWKGRAAINWDLDPVSAAVFVNYVGDYSNTGVSPAQHVGSYTTVDANLTYKLPGKLNGMRVAVQAQNLLDSTPPFYNASGGYDALQASPLGRTVSVALRAHFF